MKWVIQAGYEYFFQELFIKSTTRCLVKHYQFQLILLYLLKKKKKKQAFKKMSPKYFIIYLIFFVYK